MFNSKKNLYFSIFIVLTSVFYLFFTRSNLEKLKLSSHTIFEIPLQSNNLAIKLDGKCIGQLSIEHELGTIIKVSGSIVDTGVNSESKLAVFNSSFNIMGQLLKLNLNYGQKDYVLRGVKELSFAYDDVKKIFKGPVNIVIEDNKLKIIYRYLEDKFIDRIQLIKLKDCHA